MPPVPRGEEYVGWVSNSPDVKRLETMNAEAQAALRCYQEGRLAETRERCVEALRTERHAGLLHLLALVDYQEGHLDAGLSHAEEALALRPDSAPVLNTLGAICRRRGDDTRAEELLRRAVEVDPALGPAHFNLARLLHRRRSWGKARQHYLQALAPRGPEAAVTPLPGLPDEARGPSHLPASLPSDLIARQGWLECLMAQVLMPLTPEVRGELERSFDVAGLDHQGAGTLVLQSLTHERSWPALTEAARAGDAPRLRALSAPLWRDRLLNLALRLSLCTDPEVEEVLTAWRRTLALHGIEGHTDMAVSLALQGRNNEFVFAVTAEESDVVEARSPLDDDDSRLIVAMYRPSEAERTHLKQRAATIPSLTRVTDGVSAAVRDQYEEHPYPRWRSLHRHSARPLSEVIEQACGARPYGLDAHRCRILVAGCGTGRVALSLATQIAGAEVQAIDLSRTSLAYGLEMAEHLGIGGVRFCHGDIIELGALHERFDFIDCSGVLHHMADPLQGWRILRERLVPRGVMRVALYSRTARRGVNVARALAHALGEASETVIRAWRQQIRRLPADHPARSVVTVQDFYSMSGCRDLAFHVQEQQLDLPRIGEMLDALELELLGFEVNDAVAIATFHTLFGDDASRASLTLWKAFENLYPDTFLRMYSLWCRSRR